MGSMFCQALDGVRPNGNQSLPLRHAELPAVWRKDSVADRRRGRSPQLLRCHEIDSRHLPRILDAVLISKQKKRVILTGGRVSFNRHHEKTSEWRAWVRQYGSALTEHGLPLDAVRTELDWYLFLDHGYIQSAERSPADWWTIRLLSADQAMWLARFIQEHYPGKYPELVAALRREAT